MKTTLSSGSFGGIILLQEYGTRWAQMGTCHGSWHPCHVSASSPELLTSLMKCLRGLVPCHRVFANNLQ